MLRREVTAEGYVQLIANERQWCYEPHSRDEAEDFGDERIEAAEDEETSEDGGTDVSRAKDAGWVATLDDSMTARAGVYGHAQYGASSQYCLYGRSDEGAQR